MGIPAVRFIIQWIIVREVFNSHMETSALSEFKFPIEARGLDRKDLK
jgi:hypothetical protein